MARPADPHAREALIAAARVEFSRRGLRGVRVEDITAACGLSKGAFYLHFPSKEALFGSLVEAFTARMKWCSEERRRLTLEYFAREGALTHEDLEQRSARFLGMASLEAACDRGVLEAMWEYRDVLNVLVTGCQGTEFEGVAWQIVEAEEERIVREFAEHQALGGCRPDVPPEVFASMITGTYLRIGQRMNKMPKKPELGALAASILTLVREGTGLRPPAARHLQAAEVSPPGGAQPAAAPAGGRAPRKLPRRTTPGRRLAR